ncbi:AsmA-like C-terminal region-containing protein [Gymnodinialimonas ulvae]|uniref:AsmA-like C-terminal region-containing protein n=1 Tax=Gymnodinialimonas ulvae TaxID=3126504 RepID=UPI00309B719A
MEQSETSPAETTHPRRRFWFRALGVVLLVLLLPVVALWARLFVAPMTLPDGMQARIEATINDAMTTGDVSVGDMRLALPEGGRAPEIEFQDVALSTPEGEVRALFPGLRVRVAPGPLVGGALRVRNVTVTDAGLNLRRGEDGRLDLGFAGAETNETEAPEVSLADTLARLDRMFASAIFSQLEEVRGEGMTVRLTDAMTDRDMRLHGATMVLERRQGQMGLSVVGRLDGSRDATLDISLNRRAGGGETEVSLVFDTLAARDLAASSPALAWLDLMRAPIDGSLTATMGDDGTLGAVDGQLRIGAGVLSLPGQDDPVPFNAMAARLAYDPDTRRADLRDVRLSADQLSFTARGHADVAPDGSMYVGQFTLGDIVADPEGLFDAPLAIDGASVDLRLTLGEAVVAEVGQAVLYDDDLRATASGTLRAAPDGVSMAVDAHLSRANVRTILTYWPRAAIPNSRWWVEERLLAAEVEGVDFALRRGPGEPTRYEVSFDFSGADIRALPAAPPIRDASGVFNLQDTRMVVGIDSGRISVEGQSAASLGGSTMVIDDVSVRGPRAEFDLAISGAVPDVMHVLAGPPFAVLQASGFEPEDIGTGVLTARARLATRLVQQDADAGLSGLEIDVDGEVTDFRATELVPGRTLEAERLTIRMNREELAIGGRARFDGVPVSGQWSVQVSPGADPGSLVQARATLDRQALETFGVALPDWLLTGRGPADLTVFLRANGPATMQIRSELDGIGLAIPPLAWRLPEAATGAFSADIRLGPRPEVRQISLSGADLTLEGAISFTNDGWLDRFSAGQFRVGDWLDVRGGLVARRGQSPAIEVSGGLLDFRFMPSLSSTGGSSSGDVGPLNIALDRMQIANGIALTNLRADLDGATMSGDFRGLVNETAAVTGQLVPGANGPSVRMQSDDGGAVLRAANIITNIHGGPFDLILTSRAEQGQYDGQVTIESPRLRDAPVMAEILNLISVVGLLEQLGGDGINLGQVNGRFRVTPDQITVTQGAAVGPSMGISMDGVYDVASERYELQGVVSPFYLVNGLFGAIFATRQEGLFGFNYRVIGDAEDTRVSVNPLSLLTPGIFREIFRAPPPDFSQ